MWVCLVVYSKGLARCDRLVIEIKRRSVKGQREGSKGVTISKVVIPRRDGFITRYGSQDTVLRDRSTGLVSRWAGLVSKRK
jgi:hypothetical protein